MFELPLEAVSMLGSTVLGGVMKLWSQSQADRAEQQKQLLERREQNARVVQQARQMQNPNAAWVRRFIVVTSMLGGLGIVFVAPLMDLHTNVPIEVQEGFKFLFFDTTSTTTEYLKLDGFVTPEWLPVAIMNIIGFYFGANAVKR